MPAKKQVDASAATVSRELTLAEKPIAIGKAKGGYTLHVNGVPLVEHEGAMNFPRQRYGKG